MEDTSGFFSIIEGVLQYAPNFVAAPTFELQRDLATEYTYPVNGWYWFNSLEEAKKKFGIKI